METQDHKLPKQSGHEGQVYVCHKCGWPYPNPHPSAKHRRSHKKVCGKIEGYKLSDDVTDKTQVMNGSDGEHVSDDEGKTPSGKLVENTISRKSSSGVSSRLSRSTRSEEELFTDAVTDFTDGSGSNDVATEDVIQRFYSIKNDIEDINYNAENSSADNTSAAQLHVKDHQDQVQTVPNSTSENETVEASSVDQTVEESSKTQHEQDIIAKPYNESVLSEEKPELIRSYDDSTSKALENVNSKNNIKNLHDKDAIGNFSTEQSFEDIDANNENTGKLSDVMEDHNFPSYANHEVIVENHEVSDNKKISSEDNDLQSGDGMEGKLEHDVGQNSIVDLNTVGVQSQSGDDHEVSDNKKFSSEDNDLQSGDDMEGKVENDVGQNSVVDLDTVGVQSQISPDVDVGNHESEVGTDLVTESFENGKNVEEQKPVVSLEDTGNIHESNNTGNDEKIGDVQTHLEGNERSEIEDTNPGSGSGIDGPQDGIEKPDPENTGISLREVDSLSQVGQGVLEKSDSDLISNVIQGEDLEVCEDGRSFLQSSGVEDSYGNKFGEETNSVVERDGNNTIGQHLAISAVDVPDSSSQADSLEGNWGSVSVMSAISDTTPAAETLASIQPMASPTEQTPIIEPKSPIENQKLDSQTSVDPNLGFSKTEAISEIQTLDEQQNGSTVSPNNLSIGRKSTEKNHTALKTLLGEATARSRAESPIHYNQIQSSTSTVVKDEVSIANNGFSTTEKVVHSSNDSEMDATNEVGKEWDSPAKYPVNIKTEKKRGKNKTWMPFFCCSSVNAR